MQGVSSDEASSGGFGSRGNGARGRPRGMLKRTRRRSLGHPRRAVTQTSKQLRGCRARVAQHTHSLRGRGARDPHRITVDKPIPLLSSFKKNPKN